MKFDWFYNTLTKKDAANLASSFVNTDRCTPPRTPTRTAPRRVRPSRIDPAQGGNDGDRRHVDGRHALVYPISTNSDDVVASALAEHAANVNYVALLTGIAKN